MRAVVARVTSRSVCGLTSGGPRGTPCRPPGGTPGGAGSSNAAVRTGGVSDETVEALASIAHAVFSFAVRGYGGIDVRIRGADAHEEREIVIFILVVYRERFQLSHPFVGKGHLAGIHDRGLRAASSASAAHVFVAVARVHLGGSCSGCSGRFGGGNARSLRGVHEATEACTLIATVHHLAERCIRIAITVAIGAKNTCRHAGRGLSGFGCWRFRRCASGSNGRGR